MRRQLLPLLILSTLTASFFAPAAAALGAETSPPTAIPIATDALPLREGALGSDGDALTAAWVQGAFGATSIRVSTSKDDGVTWSAPATVAGADQHAARPSVVRQGDRIVVGWWRYANEEWSVHAAFSTDEGATWSVPALLDVGGYAQPPTLRATASSIIATWLRFTEGSWQTTTSATVDGGVTWSAPRAVSPSSLWATDEQLSASGDTASLIWRRYDRDYATYARVEVASSTDGGESWSEPIALSTPDVDAGQPAIDVAPSLTAAAWVEYGDASSRVHVATSSNHGQTWSAAPALTPVSGYAEEPTVSIIGTSVTVTWLHAENGNLSVRGIRSLDAGLSWGDVAIIAEESVGRYPAPRVVTVGPSVAVVYAVVDSVSGGTQGPLDDEDDYEAPDVYYRAETSTLPAGSSTWSEPIVIGSPSLAADSLRPTGHGEQLGALWLRSVDNRWVLEFLGRGDAPSDDGAAALPERAAPELAATGQAATLLPAAAGFALVLVLAGGLLRRRATEQA